MKKSLCTSEWFTLIGNISGLKWGKAFNYVHSGKIFDRIWALFTHLFFSWFYVCLLKVIIFHGAKRFFKVCAQNPNSAGSVSLSMRSNTNLADF